MELLPTESLPFCRLFLQKKNPSPKRAIAPTATPAPIPADAALLSPPPFLALVSSVAPVGCGNPPSVALASDVEALGEVVVLNVEAVDADDVAVSAEEDAVAVDEKPGAVDEKPGAVDEVVADTNDVVFKLHEVVEPASLLVDIASVVVVEVNVDNEVLVLVVAVGRAP